MATTPTSLIVAIRNGRVRDALPLAGPHPRMSNVTVRRPSFALLGAVLALVAMLGLSALSGWHSATIHDHAPVHASSAEHSHEKSDQKDSDGPIHVLAHATGQWLAAAGQPLVPTFSLVKKLAWASVPPVISGGLDPSKLLRPPRG